MGTDAVTHGASLYSYHILMRQNFDQYGLCSRLREVRVCKAMSEVFLVSSNASENALTKYDDL